MTDQPFMKGTEVCLHIGISRTTLWRMVKAGTFPAPLALTVKTIRWRTADVERWIETYGNDNERSA